MTTARPGLDPELQGLLSSVPEAPPLGKETLEAIRPFAAGTIEAPWAATSSNARRSRSRASTGPRSHSRS